MSTRTILIPVFYYPGGTTPSTARIHIELVDSDGVAVIGFAPEYGIARRLSVTTGETEQEIELEPNEDLYPESSWKFTLVVGNVQTTFMVTLEAGDPIDLRDLLYGDESA